MLTHLSIRDVVLIEAHEIGSAASGRNGGFMDSSLTHGIANAQQRFPDEVGLLEDLGLENLNEIEVAIKRYNIDCDFERNGVIEIAFKIHKTYGTSIKSTIGFFILFNQLHGSMFWSTTQGSSREGVCNHL